MNREYLTKTDCDKPLPKETVRTNTFFVNIFAKPKGTYFGLWREGCNVTAVRRKETNKKMEEESKHEALD